MTCPDCKYQWVPALSKRVIACPNCLHKERTGESLVDYKKRKARESLEASRLRAKAKADAIQKSNIPQRSEKGRKLAALVVATKAKLKDEHSDGEEYARCEGCHQYFKGLDASHKVSLARSLALAADPDNIRLLCRDCHNKWESSVASEMVQLKCFEDDMGYLLDFDPERFWKIFHRLIGDNNQKPTPKLEAIIRRLEKLE